jgi:AraC-like DNA-binding protein
MSAMTYFHQQVLYLRSRSVPKDYLVRQVMQSRQYIDEHYASDLDVGKMAREASLSKFHFIRLFRLVYGRTPHQYLIEVRVQKARQLLASGRPVMEACHEVGFTSLSSFTGLFKRMTGSSPAVFRQRNRALH